MSAECPTCGRTTSHVVLKAGANPVVRCSMCGMVHAYAPRKSGERFVRVVVSSGEHTEVMRVRVAEDEVLELGTQRLFEDEEGGVVRLCEITALDVDGRRVERARGGEADTVWARAIDEVVLKVSYPDGRLTRSLSVRVEGEMRVEVGRTYTFEGRRLVVHKIKIRNGGYISRKGGGAPAHTIKRVFAKIPRDG